MGTIVLEAVLKKLNDPQPDDPFEPEIAQVWIQSTSPSLKIDPYCCHKQVLRDNKAKFNDTAAAWTKQ